MIIEVVNIGSRITKLCLILSKNSNDVEAQDDLLLTTRAANRYLASIICDETTFSSTEEMLYRITILNALKKLVADWYKVDLEYLV